MKPKSLASWTTHNVLDGAHYFKGFPENFRCEELKFAAFFFQFAYDYLFYKDEMLYSSSS
jgi:hypothetical protein